MNCHLLTILSGIQHIHCMIHGFISNKNEVWETRAISNGGEYSFPPPPPPTHTHTHTHTLAPCKEIAFGVRAWKRFSNKGLLRL